MKRTNSLKVIFLGLTVLASVCVAGWAAEPKDNWEKSCAKCHGADGKGDTKIGKVLAIKDFTDAKFQESLKDEVMVKAIKEGVKDGEKTRMKPAEGLNEAEVTALVAYVRAFKK